MSEDKWWRETVSIQKDLDPVKTVWCEDTWKPKLSLSCKFIMWIDAALGAKKKQKWGGGGLWTVKGAGGEWTSEEVNVRWAETQRS